MLTGPADVPAGRSLFPGGTTVDRLDATDPQRVGPYTLFGRLGVGGMGAVYLGRSSGGRTVAVKVVKPELAGDAAFRDRFRAEVAAARAVSGAFTAPVVDDDPEAAVPWMATAFVAGVPLSQAVSTRGPLPETSLWMLAAGVAEALGDIHRAKLIHRDLKPSNILLAPDGPHVIDFGITRAMDAASPLTATGAVIGSPGFMSPEQVLGEAIGPESDMFSLGATLVYAATGHGAYGEGSTPALMFRVANSEPDPAALAAVPGSLRDAVAACLHRDPKRRPTPRQLADYVDQNMAVTAGGSWLPPALTADVVAAGAVVTGAAAHADYNAPNSGQGTWSQQPQSGPQYGPAARSGLGGGAPSTWPNSQGGGPGGPGGGMGGGPSGPSAPGGTNRRNILLAAGGAVVLVGGGVGIAVAASGGGGKPDPNPATTPTTSGPGPGPNPTTATTSSASPLPTPSGSLGTLAGPQAKPAWTKTLNESSASLQLSGNTLVNKGDSGISGYDAATGSARWPKTVPVQDGGMLVVGATAYAGGDLESDSGGTEGLFAIDVASGQEAWRFPITSTDSLPSSIAGVLNDIVFVQGQDDAGRWVWAIDAKTRKLLWRVTGKDADGAVHVPASGTKIYLATQTRQEPYAGQIQQYDAANGAKGWTLSVPKGPLFNADSAASLVMGAGSLIYLADQAYAVDPATGKQRWAFTPAGADLPNGWPAISPDGNLLILTGVSTVFAVDAKTGQQKWKTSLPAASTQSLKQMESGVPQVADGNVYVQDSKNNLWALDVATGATRWQFNFPVEPQWVAGGGYVYAAYGTALVAITAAGK